MQAENNLIKPTQPVGPQPPSFDRPITVGHQAVMSTPPTENSDGSTAIPVTVNHSFSPVPPPATISEAPAPEIPTAPTAPAPVPPSSDSHPLQVKIDAHPLFQKEGYNPAPSAEGVSSTVAPLPLAKRRRRRKLLWTVLIIIALLGSYTAVDALTDVKLPYEFFKKATPASQSQQSAVSIPLDWVWYENKDIGFKFAHPKEWGSVIITDNAESISKGSEKGTSYQFSFSSEPKVKVGVQEKNWEFLLGGRGGPCEAVGFTNYQPYQNELNTDSIIRLVIDEDNQQVKEYYSTGGICGSFYIWGQKKFAKNNLFNGVDYSYSDDSIVAKNASDIQNYQSNPSSVFSARLRQPYLDFVKYIQEL